MRKINVFAAYLAHKGIKAVAVEGEIWFGADEERMQMLMTVHGVTIKIVNKFYTSRLKPAIRHELFSPRKKE